MLPENARYPHLLLSTLDQVDGYEVSEVITAVLWQEPQRDFFLYLPGQAGRSSKKLSEDELAKANAIIGIRAFWPHDSRPGNPDLIPVFFSGTLVVLSKSGQSETSPDTGTEKQREPSTPAPPRQRRGSSYPM